MQPKKGPILTKLDECRSEKSQYWIMKSEPNAYSIDDLKNDKVTPWDGIRNYQARNLMMNEMKVKDTVLFYHSNAKPPGVVGIATISKPAFPDPEQFNAKSKYFDAKSPKDQPRWWCVEVKYKKKLKKIVTLDSLKENPKLEDMLVVQRGQRLSILPITENEYTEIIQMSQD